MWPTSRIALRGTSSLTRLRHYGSLRTSNGVNQVLRTSHGIRYYGVSQNPGPEIDPLSPKPAEDEAPKTKAAVSSPGPQRPKRSRPLPARQNGPTSPLEGRHVVVVGATGFIGGALARAFARWGCRVTMVGRREDTLESMKEKVDSESRSTFQADSRRRRQVNGLDGVAAEQMPGRGEGGGKNTTKENVDPSRYTTGNKFLAYQNFDDLTTLLKNERHIDILVNSAGRFQMELHWKTDVPFLMESTNANLNLTMVACQAATKGLIRATNQGTRDSVILNISSLLGVQGGRGAAAYSASKAGVIGFTRGLASEMGRLGVRVNCLVPGFVDGGGMVDKLTENKVLAPLSESYISKIPLGRYATVDEIVDAAQFLVTNRYANNCVLNLDGGLSTGEL